MFTQLYWNGVIKELQKGPQAFNFSLICEKVSKFKNAKFIKNEPSIVNTTASEIQIGKKTVDSKT